MIQAPTYQEPNWRGVVKTRCWACGKVCYGDEAEARMRAAQISKRTPMKAYIGRCGHWHVTRIRRKQTWHS